MRWFAQLVLQMCMWPSRERAIVALYSRMVGDSGPASQCDYSHGCWSRCAQHHFIMLGGAQSRRKTGDMHREAIPVEIVAMTWPNNPINVSGDLNLPFRGFVDCETDPELQWRGTWVLLGRTFENWQDVFGIDQNFISHNNRAYLRNHNGKSIAYFVQLRVLRAQSENRAATVVVYYQTRMSLISLQFVYF